MIHNSCHLPLLQFGTTTKLWHPRTETGQTPAGHSGSTLQRWSSRRVVCSPSPTWYQPPGQPGAVRGTPALTWQHPEPPQHPAPERPRTPAPHSASSASGRKATGLQLSLPQGSAHRVAPPVSTPPGGGDADTTCPAWGTDVSVLAACAEVAASQFRGPTDAAGHTHFAMGSFKVLPGLTPLLTAQGCGPQPLGSTRGFSRSLGLKALG